MQRISVLATDMDGTFIPLDGNEANRRDLQRLCTTIEQLSLELVYVTGRHFELVLDAIESHQLPTPQWLICDVGTSIYKSPHEERHELLESYHAHLSELVGTFKVADLAERFSAVGDLRLQEPEKQGPFKLSYYCDAGRLEELSGELSESLAEMSAPYRIIASVDPFTGDGLIDFLPRGVSKDYALRWWVDHTGRTDEAIVFAGDSGNDLAALTAGYRSIVVSNADDSVAEQVADAHRVAGWTDRLFRAQRPATSGVLEGLEHFLNSS